MRCRKMPLGLFRSFILVVAQTNHRLRLRRPVLIVCRIAAKNNHRVGRTGVKILQVGAGRFFRRNQRYCFADTVQRRIDGMGNQMHFNRLTLARDNQNLAAIRNQILGALSQPRQHLRGAIQNLRQNSSRNFNNLRSRNPEPMIRARTGEREQRFHRVKPAHLFSRLATGGKFADVLVCTILAAEKITIKRQDDFRLVKMEHRLHRLAERLRGRALVAARINCVAGEPLRFRKFLRDDLLQPRPRRRGAAFGEEGEAFTRICRKLLGEFA